MAYCLGHPVSKCPIFIARFRETTTHLMRSDDRQRDAFSDAIVFFENNESKL